MTIRWLRRRLWRRDLQRSIRPANIDELAGAYPMTDAERNQTRQEVIGLVNSMAPGGIDEGTGHALDQFIDSWLGQWQRTVSKVHLDRQTTAEHLIGLAAADRERWRHRLEATQRRLAHCEQSLEASVAQLTGGQTREHTDRYTSHYTTMTPSRLSR